MGCRGSEVPALLLEELLREHRRAGVGGGQRRQTQAGRLQAGTQRAAAGGGKQDTFMEAHHCQHDI